MSATAASPTMPSEAQTIVLRVPIHCEGCRKQVTKIVTGLDGLQEYKVDLAGQIVTVKGTLDPAAVVETISKKTGKPTELCTLSPAESGFSVEAKKDETDPETEMEAKIMNDDYTSPAAEDINTCTAM